MMLACLLFIISIPITCYKIFYKNLTISILSLVYTAVVSKVYTVSVEDANYAMLVTVRQTLDYDRLKD